MHVFCHAVPGGWHAMGVMLSAAGSLQWARDTFAPGVPFDELMAEAEAAPAGAGGILFLPYLSGERTPHADPDARGALVGLSASHTRGDVMRAVLEGVAFGLADSFDLLRELGVETTVARASGGGARSDLWLRICASVLGVPVCRMSVDEGSAFGAAMLGGDRGRDVRRRRRGRRGVRARARPDRSGAGLARPLRRTAGALPRALSRAQERARVTLRIGLLSTARINEKLAAGARASSRVRVVAIASRELARAQAQARELGVETAHGSYEALLADPSVDAVYVSLPNELHHEWSLRAIAAGKHVLCEKPYSRSAAEVHEAFAAAEAAGVVLAEALMWRHHPQTLRLAELVAGGAIGELRMVRAAFSFPLERPARHAPARGPAGGGADGRRLLLRQRRAHARGRAPQRHRPAASAPAGVDRRLIATLRHEGDVLTQFDCALDLPERSELEVDRLRRRPARERPLARHRDGHRARAPATGAASTSRSRRPTPTAASSTTSRRPSRASTRPARVGRRARPGAHDRRRPDRCGERRRVTLG